MIKDNRKFEEMTSIEIAAQLDSIMPIFTAQAEIYSKAPVAEIGQRLERMSYKIALAKAELESRSMPTYKELLEKHINAN